ncbi:PREDICTED: gamma-2-syntrophin-like [Priapulus caudatus]|uniref:Gamma-2-syntrophin-like n=1 Tax=Priapulus caudatus TaxID=37621 RepID=A0ABM1F709_PRICU|nr:PREDICTED: gamma-2-syntrophin-like [Priapulus caudatus]
MEQLQPALPDVFEVRYGMVTVSDGKGKPQPTRLQLAGSGFTLQKEELVYAIPTDMSDPAPVDGSKDRDIVIVRNKAGLGLSIKGGAEHNLPLLISRIFKDGAADAINGESVECFTHDAAVELLRRAGDSVLLTVRHYKVAAPFLKSSPKKIDRCMGNCDDVKQKCGGHSCGNMPKLEKHWTDVLKLNLLMAYITRYMMGTDKLRPNSFEVLAMDCRSSGVVHCDDTNALSDWVKHISNNIMAANVHHIKMLNRALPAQEQILFIGWACERMPSTKHWQTCVWRPRFIVLKGCDVCFLDNPPLQREDWLDCEPSYRIVDTIFHIYKRMLTPGIKASGNCVNQIGSKTFACSYRDKPAGLTLDMTSGFSLFDTESKQYLWRYKFSQLKGSSDDGETKVKLMLQEGKLVETRELECATLQSLLFCMNAFLTAKLAAVDPSFLKSS